MIHKGLSNYKIPDTSKDFKIGQQQSYQRYLQRFQDISSVQLNCFNRDELIENIISLNIQALFEGRGQYDQFIGRLGMCYSLNQFVIQLVYSVIYAKDKEMRTYILKNNKIARQKQQYVKRLKKYQQVIQNLKFCYQEIKKQYYLVSDNSELEIDFLKKQNQELKEKIRQFDNYIEVNQYLDQQNAKFNQNNTKFNSNCKTNKKKLNLQQQQLQKFQRNLPKFINKPNHSRSESARTSPRKKQSNLVLELQIQKLLDQMSQYNANQNQNIKQHTTKPKLRTKQQKSKSRNKNIKESPRQVTFSNQDAQDSYQFFGKQSPDLSGHGHHQGDGQLGKQKIIDQIRQLRQNHSKLVRILEQKEKEIIYLSNVNDFA